ncbi:MAG: hypothetical protein KUG77_04935 [Nannocystaceae bacterium]|nr:hypothetical protein [Nannocystaceae bacterium]
MRHPFILASALLALASACDTSIHEAAEQREGLLFGLTQDDVQQLHDDYVPEEDIQLTTDRLTAPFNCDLYDDLCDQVGRDQAIEFTMELVDLTMQGASDEEVEAFSEDYMGTAMKIRSEQAEDLDNDDGVVLRSWSSWTTVTAGSTARLKVRNGITTPLVGKRKAWTEAMSYRRYGLGWASRTVDRLCSNGGTSTQTRTVCEGGAPCSTLTVDTSNPPNTCEFDSAYVSSFGLHQRNSGGDNAIASWTYRLRAGGSGSILHDGVFLNTAAAGHVRTY